MYDRLKKEMKTITVKELKEKLDAGEDIQVIDVREDYEVETASFGAEHIALGDIPHSEEKIAKDKPVIVHCRSGKRSANAILFLEQNYGFDNLYNLEGGIIAWAKEIDPSLSVS